MSFIGKAIGNLTGANQAAAASQAAAATQAQAAQRGISAQQKGLRAALQLMKPFVSGGSSALGAQRQLLGLGGVDAQERAISGIEQSPLFQAQLAQAEEAMLQNASATGGLRGGNIQEALARFRPQLLAQTLQQQFQNLGGLSQLGQAAAAGQAASGLQTGANIANLIGQQGAAIAGGQLAAGQRAGNIFGQAVQLGGIAAGLF